jgi:hypothetical protein
LTLFWKKTKHGHLACYWPLYCRPLIGITYLAIKKKILVSTKFWLENLNNFWLLFKINITYLLGIPLFDFIKQQRTS